MTRDLTTWSGLIRRARPRSVALVALVGVAMLIAGCGGGSSLTVASMPGVSKTARHVSATRTNGGAVRFLGGAPSPAQQAGAEVTQLKFSRCMRSRGVPNFPDPVSPSGGGFGFISFGGSGIDPAAPLFRRAQRSCFAILTRRRVVVG